METSVHDAQRLKELQALPLGRKVQITQTRIIEWYQHWKGKVVVSFSGGKDSTVLLTIARQLYPDIPAVFCNTGLEYPEIQKFVRDFGNVDIITPEMRFDRVVSAYGYPLISKEVSEAVYYARAIRKEGEPEKFWSRKHFKEERKKTSFYPMLKWLPLASELPALIGHKCCNYMKKYPDSKYRKQNNYKPIIGTLAEESWIRRQKWYKTGCNSFEGQKAASKPLSFWTEQDILQYLSDYGIKIASVYGDIVGEPGNLHCTGCTRTGCVFCGFGAHLEKGETRFQRLARTHPRQYEYCIGGGQWSDNPHYDPTAPEYDGEWKNWNPKMIWTPSKEGLGMGKLFDMVNDIYGKELIRYK